MSVSVTFCGTTYTLPQQSDATAWGTNLTAYLQALANAPYFPSTTANPASAGLFRLAKTDSITWRNNANSGDVSISKGTADQLQWNGVDLTGNPQAIYNTAAGQSIPNNTVTIVNFGTLELDSASAVTTGASWKFTVPTGKAGLYAIEAGVTWNAAVAAGIERVDVYKNGVLARCLYKNAEALTANAMIGGSCTLNLAAADFIDIRVTQTSGGAVVLTSTAAENFVCIHRLVS